jgi:membrane protein DedA with SNARE-associated domain
MESILAWISQYGYVGLFASLMLGIAGLPIPDETILVFCGYLISSRRLDLTATFATAVCGSICGISLSYIIGRTAAHSVIFRYGRYVGITPAHVERAHQWFHRIGEWILTFGYFIPGVRHFTALVAGMSELEFLIFARFAYSGAVLWVSTFLAIGYFVGEQWRAALELVHRYTLVFILIAALICAGAWWIRKRRRAPSPHK